MSDKEPRPPNPRRPRWIGSIQFMRALVAAGIIDDKLDSIAEVRIIADPSDAVKIHVEYIADERLCNLFGGWDELKQAYGDQMVGRRARLLQEEMEAEEESERNKTLPSVRTDGWDAPDE